MSGGEHKLLLHPASHSESAWLDPDERLRFKPMWTLEHGCGGPADGGIEAGSASRSLSFKGRVGVGMGREKEWRMKNRIPQAPHRTRTSQQGDTRAPHKPLRAGLQELRRIVKKSCPDHAN